MNVQWQRGLALVAVLMVAGFASAQDRKDFFKKPMEGPRGFGEIEKARADVKALEGQIEKLKQQIGEMSKKIASAPPPGKGPEGMKKFGPPDGKGPPWARGGDGEKKFGPPEGKGPPPMARDGGDRKKGPPEGKGPPDGKGGPPWARGGEGSGRFGPPPGFPGRGGFGSPWGPPGFEARRPPQSGSDPRGSGSSRDLEARVSRIERSLEELRREIRERRR